MQLAAAVMVLSCGLNASPDGVAAPAGKLAVLTVSIPDNLAKSLESGSPPPASMVFSGEASPAREWIVGMKTDPTQGAQISRFSQDIFGFKIRIGWAVQATDGTYTFKPTSSGSCQVKPAPTAVNGNAQ
jgi:hypothetical protein